MLKKTLIALAALSSVAVMFPAQAQDWENRHREGHQSQSPQIRFVVYQHAERNHYRHHGHQQYRQYRHYDHRQGYGQDHRQGHGQGRGRDHGQDHRQDRGQDHRGNHR